MGSYLLLMLSFLIISFFVLKLTPEGEINFQVVSCILLLFLFFGLRDLPILNDTAHYYNYAISLCKSDFINQGFFAYNKDSIFEPGFQIYAINLMRIFEAPYSLILITAIITSVSLVLFLKGNTRYISFCLFFMMGYLILPAYFSALRQSIAVSLSFLMYYALSRQKYLWAAIFGVTAYFFHYSAIILFLPIALSFINFKDRNLLYIGGCTLLVASFILPILVLLGHGESLYFETMVNRENIPLAQFLNACIFLSCLILYRYNEGPFEDSVSNATDKIFLSFAISGVIINIIAIPALILSRYSMYFAPYCVVLVVNSVFEVEDQKIRQWEKGIIVVGCIAYAVICLTYKNEWFHFNGYGWFDFRNDLQKVHFGY